MHKKLKELSDQEVTRLEVSCSSFYLSYSKTNQFQKQVNEILAFTGNSYKEEVWLIVTALVRSKRQNNHNTKFSLNKNSYTEARKKGFKFSYTKTRRLLEILEEAGYLTVYLGDKTSHVKRRRTSIITFHYKFSSMFDKKVVDNNIMLSYNSPVEIRDSITKEILSDTKITNIKALKEEVNDYNALLNNTEIRVFDVSCGVLYKRIFSDNMNSGGRWYSGEFQTIKSSYREHILFDGEKTVEVDVESIHPSIIGCLQGVKLPEDFKPYECYQDFKGDPIQLRKLFKQALMCMLYANSKRQAKSSLFDKYIQDKNEGGVKYGTIKLNKGDINKIFDALTEHNNFLSDRLYIKDSWRELQFLDASICRVVINSFVEKGLPILAYHDSWVVSESNKNLLIDVMKKAWKEVLGTDMNFKFKIN